MEEYMYTKLLGLIVGILTIIGAIGFGILSFLGAGLSNALNTGYDYSSTSSLFIIVFISLISLGLITGIGTFWLKRKAWRGFYIGFSLMLGIGFVITFFISFGALGLKNEIFILCIGVIYLWLSYLVIKKK